MKRWHSGTVLVQLRRASIRKREVNPWSETISMMHTLHERSCEVERGERYSREFRQQAVQRMKGCNSILGLSRELGIHRRLLYNWREAAEINEASRRPLTKDVLGRQFDEIWNQYPSVAPRLDELA